MLVSAFISYRVQQYLYTILGKTSYIYTYKTSKTPHHNSVHNSKKKTAIHLPTLLEQAFPVFKHIVILMQCKIYFYIRNSILGIYDESNLM